MGSILADKPGPDFWPRLVRRVYDARPALRSRRVFRRPLLALIVALASTATFAQEGRGRGAAATPRASAPIDLTGYWVSLVTDDWRWRMVTPPKGDALYLPVNDAGRKVAEAWDPAKDE